MKAIPITEGKVVLRTDFSEDATWDSLCAAIQEPDPVYNFENDVKCISDRDYDGLTVEQLICLIPREVLFIFVADRITFTHPERPILVVDLYDEPGRTFRVIPPRFWAVENNLKLVAMVFDEFAEFIGPDGIFRGFPASLHAELQPDIESVAGPLIDFSKQCLRDRGSFLPHAAVLTAQGKVELVAASSGSGQTDAAEILPLLHGALRALAKREALAATGVAESVIVTFPGEPPAKAVKVLFEHWHGLAVALYVRYEEDPQKGVVFSPVFSTLAAAEVKAF